MPEKQSMETQKESERDRKKMRTRIRRKGKEKKGNLRKGRMNDRKYSKKSKL